MSTNTNIQRINDVVSGPKIQVDVDVRGLGRYLFDKIKQHDKNVFQINAADGTEETYGYVNRKCIRLALELKKRGINEKDVVLICSGNTMDSVVPLLGTLYVNAITVTLDPSVPLRHTIHLLNIVRPKMIFVEEVAIELIEDALKESTYKTELVVMGNHEKYSRYAEFLEPNPQEEFFVPENVENIKNTAALFFSSGTTGLPKAIELSHYGIITVGQSSNSLGFSYGTILFFTSYYWISAFYMTISVILKGTQKVVIRGFIAELALKCMHTYKVTDTFFAPSFSYRISDELVETYPCPELQTLSFGGSTLNTEQMKKMRRYFPNAKITLIYAQTESGVISVFPMSNFHEKYRTKFSSSGPPTANTCIKIVDFDTEVVLGPYQKGEIRVKTATSCNGYYNQDSSDIYDNDGYVKTGDVGYFDEDNCIYVCDRIKDMFKYQSWHIVPLSIENIIAEHPAIIEAIVIGIPSEEDGHIPMGLVVLRKDYPTILEEDLLKFANEKLSDRERLRGGLKIVKTLPKGPTGKVLRKQITDLVITGQLQKLLE